MVLPLQVLYEDDDILAINKPPHLRFAPIHRFVGGSVLNRVLYHLHGADVKQGRMSSPHVLHRLDRDTSGVAILGKNVATANYLHEQFRKRTVKKEYVALCHGCPEQDEWTVDAPIGSAQQGGNWNGISSTAMMVTPEGKASVTRFKVSKRSETGRFCVIHAFPKTGRTHQIRVHLHHSGNAIVADDLYIPDNGLDCIESNSIIDRQGLHAYSIEFRHPTTKKSLIIHAPIPRDMSEAIQKLV